MLTCVCLLVCLPSARSVTSSSRDGMILSNILNFFPKRGIWRMRQDGTCGDTVMRRADSMSHTAWTSAHPWGKCSCENYATLPSTGKLCGLYTSKKKKEGWDILTSLNNKIFLWTTTPIKHKSSSVHLCHRESFTVERMFQQLLHCRQHQTVFLIQEDLIAVALNDFTPGWAEWKKTQRTSH